MYLRNQMRSTCKVSVETIDKYLVFHFLFFKISIEPAVVMVSYRILQILGARFLKVSNQCSVVFGLRGCNI